MKFSVTKSLILSLFLFLGVSIAAAQTTVTVGPTGMYPTPCAAFSHLADGDTVQIDANGGVPYHETDCDVTNNNLTITGVNGRPILDATGIYSYAGLWNVYGHDIVIDNFEFRNATGGSDGNAGGIYVKSGEVLLPNGSPAPAPGADGGNVTIQRSYIHDCGDGILSDDVGKPTSASGTYAWFSANPFVTLQYDEFYHDGDGNGYNHNTYMGYGGNMAFTLQYSWSHDSYEGIEVKSRNTFNNILYDLISDPGGNGGFMMELPQGGSTYIVGSSFERGATSCCNQAFIMWRTRDADTSTPPYLFPVYPAPNDDLHVVNNTFINDPANSAQPSFFNIDCYSQTNPCPAPPAGTGNALVTPPVFENNIFLGSTTGGSPQNPSNSSVTPFQENNIVEANTPSTLASFFVDPAHYDYHLVSGSPAIGAGIYPPTDSTGAADPNALAKYEYVNPVGILNRPTPTGSTMDAGAYSYPRVGAPPTLNLTYTESVTVPNTGTITVSGLPTRRLGS